MKKLAMALLCCFTACESPSNTEEQPVICHALMFLPNNSVIINDLIEGQHYQIKIDSKLAINTCSQEIGDHVDFFTVYSDSLHSQNKIKLNSFMLWHNETLQVEVLPLDPTCNPVQIEAQNYQVKRHETLSHHDCGSYISKVEYYRFE